MRPSTCLGNGSCYDWRIIPYLETHLLHSYRMSRGSSMSLVGGDAFSNQHIYTLVTPFKWLVLCDAEKAYCTLSLPKITPVLFHMQPEGSPKKSRSRIRM